jgi:hypothetical protein
MDKDLVSRIDYWNNIFWLINGLLDIYCDLADFLFLQKEIEALVR